MKTILNNWEFFVLIGASFYFLFKLNNGFFKKRQRKCLSIEEHLSKMARIKNCSVYDIFKAASQEWQVCKNRLEVDFKNYLLNSMIPFYVRDFIRRHQEELDQANDLPLLCTLY